MMAKHSSMLSLQMWSIYCLMQRVRGSRIHIVLCVDGIMQCRTVTLGDIRNAHSGLRGSHSERPWNVHEWPTLHSAIAQSHFRSCTRTVRSESTKKKHTYFPWPYINSWLQPPPRNSYRRTMATRTPGALFDGKETVSKTHGGCCTHTHTLSFAALHDII